MKKIKYCRYCGMSHSVYSKVECPKPDLIVKLLTADPNNQLKEVENMFLVDDRMYISGAINLYEFDHAEKPLFQINAWVSFSQEEFLSKIEAFKNESTIILNSQLENQIPFFPNSLGLLVESYLQIDYEYAVIKIISESDLKSFQNDFSSERLELLMHDLSTITENKESLIR